MSDPNDWNARVIAEFRDNGGKVGGDFEGAPLLLLHTTGARTGAERINPMMYQQLDGGWAVFASYAGRDQNPAWYHNLVTHPDDVSIEVGSQTVPVRASEAQGSERDQIWSAQKAAYPGFAEYEQKTARIIPVMILRPAGNAQTST